MTLGEPPPYVAQCRVDTDDRHSWRTGDITLTGTSLLTLHTLFARERGSERTSVYILDSGASAHMTPLRSMLVDFTPRTGLVTLGDKSVQLDIQARGHSRIRVLGPFM